MGHGHIGVALRRLKPLLQTPPAVPMLRAGLEGVAPNLLTQVSRGGEVMGERTAGGPCWTAALPCGGLRHRKRTSHSSHPHIPILCLGGAWKAGTFPQVETPKSCFPHGLCQAPLTPTPVPAAVPVGSASVGCAAVRPPLLTVLPA